MSTVDAAAVVFPYDGSVVGAAPVGTAELAARAVDEAVAVAREVAALPSRTRRQLLTTCAADWLRTPATSSRTCWSLETGKPLVDCRVEVARTIVTWEAAAEEVARLHGETVPAGPAAVR